MRYGMIGLLAISALLCGCHSEEDSFYNAPKPLDKMNHDELCAFYGKYASNPALAPDEKATAVSQMKLKGCPVG